ncbi:hypothetical protein [Micromonospora tarapacensis]|uniref:hypothetical protein n=1 Tax=Micromonospora tarapacensis TaxID=2835305 RepID=UPI001E2D29D1|nr:hypothetical protein [Micromonospora tarapacensis]
MTKKVAVTCRSSNAGSPTSRSEALPSSKLRRACGQLTTSSRSSWNRSTPTQ